LLHKHHTHTNTHTHKHYTHTTPHTHTPPLPHQHHHKHPQTPHSHPTPFSKKAKAALAIAALTLVVAAQPVHAWLTRATAHLLPLIEKRQSKEVAWNVAEVGPDKKAAAQEYSKARRAVQKEAKRAKDRHLLEHFEGLRPGVHSGQYWEIVNKLHGGLGNTRGAGTGPFFSAPDGTPTTTRVGSNAAMKEHWQHLFNMPTSAQESTLDEVRQRPERAELGDKPDDKEIIRFIRKAKSKKSPGDNNIPAEFWKALVGSDKDLQSE